MRPLLCGYDSALTSILSFGFQFGFPLHFRGDRVSFFATNLISAQHNPEIVSAKISKELAAGRIAGPFDRPPFPNFRVSPLGVVPKKAPGEYRLIHHLSFPHGASVNDGISPEDSSVQYARVDDAVTMIKKLGRVVFWLKPISKVRFVLFPFCPLTMIFWEFSGKENIIMIGLCQWDVRHHVALSRSLALLSSGLPGQSCQCRI